MTLNVNLNSRQPFLSPCHSFNTLDNPQDFLELYHESNPKCTPVERFPMRVVMAWVGSSGVVRVFRAQNTVSPIQYDLLAKKNWRNGAEELLKQTIEAGLKLKAVKATQLKRVNVDTSVQEKEIRFPIGARLYDRARKQLVKEAQRSEG